MAKKLIELEWTEDFLPQGFIRKRMFGGFSYYVDEKLILVLFESTGHKTHNGQKYNFEIWNGCMFPVVKENHPIVLDMFPFLMNHPVLSKWLYLPLETENFEERAESVLRELKKKNILFGSLPKKPSKKKSVPSKKVNMRKPQMFGDEPAEEKLHKARRILDLKNLGPEAEKHFLKAGIKTPQQFIKIGWKKTMHALANSNPKLNHSLYAYALIGALQNRLWTQISEQEKLEARTYTKKLRDMTKVKKSKTSKNRK